MSFVDRCDDHTKLGHFQSLYLSSNGADFWFIIDGERIPSHKLILAAMIPHYKKTFSDNNDQDETHITDVSVESFKEFLKFVYMVKPNLTTDNVEGVMDLAKRWQAQEIFMECEEFLKRSLNDTSMLFFGYRLASAYEANDLKKLFQDEICVKATSAFKSASFLTLPQEFLVKILECDRLACKEIEIFNACIAWATATCIRNGLDPSNAEQLRSQLVDSDALYQIRFTSMTNEETATCIGSHPNLFTAIELQEILCMVGHRKEFKAKKFNWTIRYYDLNSKNNLNCSRLSDWKSPYNVQTVEVTEFTCDCDIILHGIELEMHHNRDESIQIRIDERDRDLKWYECYNEPSIARFVVPQVTSFFELQNMIYMNSCAASIPLNRGILLRANHTYTITITFNNPNPNLLSQRTLKEKVHVDGDTVFWFSKRGIVSSLLFRRFDDRSAFVKRIHSPIFWMKLMAMAMILCSGAAIYISPELRENISKIWPTVWLCFQYAQFVLYITFGLLVLFVYRVEIWIKIISLKDLIIANPIAVFTLIIIIFLFCFGSAVYLSPDLQTHLLEILSFLWTCVKWILIVLTILIVLGIIIECKSG